MLSCAEKMSCAIDLPNDSQTTPNDTHRILYLFTDQLGWALGGSDSGAGGIPSLQPSWKSSSPPLGRGKASFFRGYAMHFHDCFRECIFQGVSTDQTNGSR